MRRRLWGIGGWTALALGAVGVVLPVMPTVPFLLLAVVCFMRSSPRMGARIVQHPLYGPPVRAYLRRGVIPTQAKAFAIAAMAGSVLFAIFLHLPAWLIFAEAAVLSAVAIYVATRPSA